MVGTHLGPLSGFSIRIVVVNRGQTKDVERQIIRIRLSWTEFIEVKVGNIPTYDECNECKIQITFVHTSV